jgi:hypothetical protein
MTNHVPRVVTVKQMIPMLPERFTQRDRDAANQRLQEAFESERMKRALNPKNTSVLINKVCKHVLVEDKNGARRVHWNSTRDAFTGDSHPDAKGSVNA